MRSGAPPAPRTAGYQTLAGTGRGRGAPLVRLATLRLGSRKSTIRKPTPFGPGGSANRHAGGGDAGLGDCCCCCCCWAPAVAVAAITSAIAPRRSCWSRITSLLLSLADDPERRVRLPPAAGEVRDVLRPAAVRHRALGERAHHAERDGVVDFHVGRHASAQALDQPAVLQEVHPPVTGRRALHLVVLPQRVLELGVVPVQRLPLVLRAPPLDVHAVRVAGEDAARAL